MFSSLFESFKQSVTHAPNADAIIYKNNRVSYKDLYAYALKVCAFLLNNGLQKGDRVALLVTNSPEYVAIYYGILAAGGVAVALNTQSKSRDIVNCLGHSDAHWLFVDATHPELNSVTNSYADNSIVVIGKREVDPPRDKNTWSEVLNQSDGLEVAVEPDDLAAIIYTSGTTGRPKGVALSHGNLKANTTSILNYLQLTQHDSLVNILPFYYSYGNSVLHTHLSSGARLILENSLLYPHKVVQTIVDEQATGFSGVPSTFALLLGRVKLADYELSSLRYLTQAGGPMAPALTHKLIEELPNTKIFIMYGQTEATARLTYLPPEKLIEKKGSVGIAIPGVRIEIRNKQGEPVEVGTEGEICALGKNIMQGYWRDEEMTTSVIKDGWLYTGDLGYYDSDGYIYINGRSSDMIKTGANRVSPKEIEEVIQEMPEVQEVAVVGVDDETLGEVIKAYVVVLEGQRLDKRKLQLHCKNNLAIYKIPKKFEFIKELPKTASGKIKKYQLKS